MARSLYTDLLVSIYLSIYIQKSILRLLHHICELEMAHDLFVAESWGVYELVGDVVALHVYLNM